MADGNMLLQGVVDANDRIRAENAQNYQKYQQTKEIQAGKEKGQEYYYGVTDAVGAFGVYSKMKGIRDKMASTGKSYGQLVGEDLQNFSSKAGQIGTEVAEGGSSAMKGLANVVDAPISAVQSVQQAFTSKVPKPGAVSSEGRVVAPDETTGVQSSSDLDRATQGDSPESTQGSAQESAGSAGTEDVRGAPEASTAPEVSSATEPESGELGSFTERAISGLTGGKAAVGTFANKALGKAVGNVGGAVDIVDDFENIGKSGGFFGGTGKTTGDKIANALTVGSTVLDVGSLFLPFLEPVAAAVQVAGAVDSTANAVADNKAEEAQQQGNYEKQQRSTEVAPNLAGLGFLASQQTDPRKAIGGAGTF